MSRDIVLFDSLGGRPAAARVVDGQLDDLLVDPPAGTVRPGAIFAARADRPVKGMGGWFLKLPDGRSAFLRHARGVQAGRIVTVQVTGHAEPGKAVPVTDRLVFKSRHCLVTPGAEGRNLSRAIRDPDARARLLACADTVLLPQDFGLILRTHASLAADDAILSDIADVSDLAQRVVADHTAEPRLLVDGPGARDLAWRDWGDLADAPISDGDGVFAANGIDEAIAALADPTEALSGGAGFFVEPTRALVAIDVNTGPDGSPAAGLKANLGCAAALPRALRLRGLGGQVTIDVAPMPKKDRKAVTAALTRALKTDPVDTSVAGWTPLGHLEVQRKRERLPLPPALLRKAIA